MDASAFEYFHVVARIGSISRAASELEMEPSTLTRHIGRLEQDVGVKLFHRSGRGMVLTDAGTLLLHEASKVVDTLGQARRLAADLAAEGPSQIVVAAQPTIAQVCFGAVTRDLRERYPRARVRLVEGYGQELLGWLQEGKVDVALLYVSGQSQLTDYDVLLHEPLNCILPPGHAAPRGPVSVSHVLDLPLILPSTPYGLRALAQGWAQRHGKPLAVTLECDGSTLMTRRLVQAGLGCTILPLAAVADEVSRHLLQAVRIDGPEALRTVALATAQNRPAVTGLREISQLLRQVVTRQVASGQWPGVDRMAP